MVTQAIQHVAYRIRRITLVTERRRGRDIVKYIYAVSRGCSGSKTDTSFEACLLAVLACAARPEEAELSVGRTVVPEGLPGPIRCIELRISMASFQDLND